MSRLGQCLAAFSAALTLVSSVLAADYVDREETLKDVSRQMDKLIKQDKLADPEDLISQLRRTRCSVSLPEPSTEELSSEEIYERNRKAVLVIASRYKCGKCTKWHTSAASGFMVTKDGVALTNYHVVGSKTNRPMAAMTYDGKVYAVTEVLAANKDTDVAAIKVDGTGFDHVSMAKTAPVGSDVWVISHPGNSLYFFSRGIVSSYFLGKHSAKLKKVKWMSITADYGKGSSGAPLFDKYGNVVGMVSSTGAVIADLKKKTKEYAQMVFKRCVPAAAIRDLFSR